LTKLYEKINKGLFVLPEYLSHQAKDLLLNVMNVDPEKRFNIEQIKNHSWFAKRNIKLDKGIMIGKEKIQINMNIIEECLEKLKDGENLTAEKIVKHLEKNDCNSLTTR
jgi:5'-AMP-activated protein kinase catalytic alpha subunit